MSKFPSPRASVSTRPVVMRTDPRAAAGTGRRVLVVGRIGPASSCGDCGGFGTAMVRVGGRLVAVRCRVCTPPADALAG